MAGKRKALQEVEGIEIIHDLGTGLVVATANIDILKEQDKNAHVMNPVMFEQLVSNIKKRGVPESLPLCALKDGTVEIISGHHRCRAAREAGCKQIPVLIDVNELTRSKIAAKQLAHNLINGFDDKGVVDEIAKLITDVDDMIESYLEKNEIEVKAVDVGALLYPSMDLDWKEVSIVFLPKQFERIDELVKSIGKKDALYLAEKERFSEIIAKIAKYQKYADIHAIGMVLDLLVRKATAEMEEVGYSDEWQTVQSCIGGGSIPKKGAQIIREAIKKMKADGYTEKKKPWVGIVKLCAEYIGETVTDECT